MYCESFFSFVSQIQKSIPVHKIMFLDMHCLAAALLKTYIFVTFKQHI